MTDTTPLPDATPPASPAPTTEATPAAAPAPPPGRKRRGILIGAIAGGAVALALTFGGGLGLGWALGAANSGPSWSANSDDRPDGGPGQWGPGGPEERQDMPTRPNDEESEDDGGSTTEPTPST